jgi:hypothetical protein
MNSFKKKLKNMEQPEADKIFFAGSKLLLSVMRMLAACIAK